MPPENDKTVVDSKKLIIDVIREKKPESVEALLEMLGSYNLPKESAIDAILSLQKEGKLSLKQETSAKSFSAFVLSARAIWFWIVTALSVSTLITVTTISESLFPLVYIRYALGSIYVSFLPGYSLLRALFVKRLEFLEEIVLSIVMSVTLVIVTGLLLNYTPWGITLTTVLSTLLGMTLSFSIVAMVRSFYGKTEKKH